MTATPLATPTNSNPLGAVAPATPNSTPEKDGAVPIATTSDRPNELETAGKENTLAGQNCAATETPELQQLTTPNYLNMNNAAFLASQQSQFATAFTPAGFGFVQTQPHLHSSTGATGSAGRHLNQHQGHHQGNNAGNTQSMRSQNEVNAKLNELTDKTGYELIQENGQRKYGGPPPNWSGPAPSKGCEVFVGKIPRDCFEDELVPVFERIGRIYELRLMMNFDNQNRGYCFVMFTLREHAQKAIKDLNNFEIRPGRFLGVCESIDNCRLFIGGIPRNKKRDEILVEMRKISKGVQDVIIYPNQADKTKNRGFAFVEYESHKAAAMARRKLIPGKIQLWGHTIAVDWAEPEHTVDDETMNQVRILYVRNLMMNTTEETIHQIFTGFLGRSDALEKVKKMSDYAFVHFKNREDAERSLAHFNGRMIDGSAVEVVWAKPPKTNSASPGLQSALPSNLLKLGGLPNAAAAYSLQTAGGKMMGGTGGRNQRIGTPLEVNPMTGLPFAFGGVVGQGFGGQTSPALSPTTGLARPKMQRTAAGLRPIPNQFSPNHMNDSFGGFGAQSAMGKQQTNAPSMLDMYIAQQALGMNAGAGQGTAGYPMGMMPFAYHNPEQALKELCRTQGWGDPEYQVGQTQWPDSSGAATAVPLYFAKVTIAPLNVVVTSNFTIAPEEACTQAANAAIAQIQLLMTSVLTPAASPIAPGLTRASAGKQTLDCGPRRPQTANPTIWAPPPPLGSTSGELSAQTLPKFGIGPMSHHQNLVVRQVQSDTAIGGGAANSVFKTNQPAYRLSPTNCANVWFGDPFKVALPGQTTVFKPPQTQSPGPQRQASKVLDFAALFANQPQQHQGPQTGFDLAAAFQVSSAPGGSLNPLSPPNFLSGTGVPNDAMSFFKLQQQAANVAPTITTTAIPVSVFNAVSSVILPSTQQQQGNNATSIANSNEVAAGEGNPDEK